LNLLFVCINKEKSPLASPCAKEILKKDNGYLLTYTNKEDGEELTPLHLAIRSNNKQLVHLLVNSGSDVNYSYKESVSGNTFLHFLCKEKGS